MCFFDNFILLATSYLHSTFSPPLAHSDLKAANVLLDEQLTPRLCDSGLAILRPLTTNWVKIKVQSEALYMSFSLTVLRES